MGKIIGWCSFRQGPLPLQLNLSWGWTQSTPHLFLHVNDTDMMMFTCAGSVTAWHESSDEQDPVHLHGSPAPHGGPDGWHQRRFQHLRDCGNKMYFKKPKTRKRFYQQSYTDNVFIRDCSKKIYFKKPKTRRRFHQQNQTDNVFTWEWWIRVHVSHSSTHKNMHTVEYIMNSFFYTQNILV